MELNEIKKHKGKLIFLNYNGQNEKHQTGIITAVTNNHVLFNVNGEFEKPILKANIKSITAIKTFSHYLRTIKRYLKENKPEKALDICDQIESIFKAENQKMALEKAKKICIEMLWKNYHGQEIIEQIDLESKLNKIML